MLKRMHKRWVYRIYDVSVLIVFLMAMACAYMLIYGEVVVRGNPPALSKVSSTTILNAEDEEVAKLRTGYKGYAEYARLEEMPKLLIDAFLATEDRRFYSHHGMDVIGIGRALLQNTLHMDMSQGGSSITQQLARNLYLNGNKTLIRKVNEASIAFALEKRYAKDDILEMYLNRIYMGRQQYGVKAAAWRYFGVRDLNELSIGQIASLAGMPKGPSIYNPVDDPRRSEQRRDVVLTIMHEQGLITRREMEEAKRAEYETSSSKAAMDEDGEPAYISALDAVLEEASQLTGRSKEQIQNAGWTIRTGLDDTAQLAMENVFQDSSRFRDDRADEQVQAGMVIVDQHNGEVKAMMGGRDPVAGGINRATADVRQPGSVFKPVIAYGPALESGRYSPNSMLPDKPLRYGGYQPRNPGGHYRGSVTMMQAVEKSINSTAVWLVNENGLDESRQFAERLGIALGDEDRNLSIALGGLHKGVSPLKMAQAYAVFANGGKFNTAHLIRDITDAQGKKVVEYRPENKSVISSRTAAEMTKMLQRVVSQGTGKRARLIGHPVAGKTGTTQAGVSGAGQGANRDLWFAGYTDRWTAAVWMGFDHTDRDHYMTAGSGDAAELFAAVMKRALP
ncbi:Penicillin-binding protein 1F [Paenibacillus sp. JJ-223]|nr:Penicillin-binding protein 1F [Paenibacillus sp. JJ-223]